MKNSPDAKSMVANNPAVIGPVTRRMVQLRSSELALGAGRPAYEVRQADYEQAKRELTGERDIDRQNAILDGTSA
jgi:hypothetical protein